MALRVRNINQQIVIKLKFEEEKKPFRPNIRVIAVFKVAFERLFYRK